MCSALRTMLRSHQDFRKQHTVQHSELFFNRLTHLDFLEIHSLHESQTWVNDSYIISVVKKILVIIKECDALGIEALTIYAFSTENWSRSKEEVGALMGLLLTYFRSEIDELDEKHVCIRILGDVEGMPAPQRQALKDAMARTGQNTGLKLNIALNYGGRDELLRAAKLLARRALEEGKDPGSFTRADLEDALYTRGLPDVDLLIRTSGEMRISNFLPYQIAYAEFVVTDTLWPDFDAAALRDAIAAYKRRDRRFGGVKDNKEN